MNIILFLEIIKEDSTDTNALGIFSSLERLNKARDRVRNKLSEINLEENRDYVLYTHTLSEKDTLYLNLEDYNLDPIEERF